LGKFDDFEIYKYAKVSEASNLTVDARNNPFNLLTTEIEYAVFLIL